jgi:uncharacterized membrane protein YdjX (TVP38/TMEM64 family)
MAVLARLWRPLLLMGGLALAGLALRELEAAGALTPGVLDRMLGATGLPRGVAFVGLGALATAVGVPRQAVAFAGGTAFGALAGTQLAIAATVLGCATSFFYARLVGRDWARQRLSGRLAKVDRFLAENPFTATLTLRLLPVGNNLALNLLAGLSGVPAGRFLAASALGYLPQTVVFALLGKGVRVDGWVQIVLGVALFAASAAIGVALLRRHRAGRAIEADAEA